MSAFKKLTSYQFDAAVTIGGGMNPTDAPHGAYWVRLHTSLGGYTCFTWIEQFMLAPTNERVPAGMANVVDVGTPSETALLLTGFDWNRDLEAASFVADDVCPIAGEVERIRALIDSVQSAPLKKFLLDSLSVENAFHYFWTCPASLRHHHSKSGGLAQHSRHVAEQAAAAVSDSPLQRDYAIAYGLLHDYGKLWSYENGHLTEESRRLGHEHIGYDQLLPGLIKLKQSWQNGGVVMQSLLSGRWKRDGLPPIQAVGNVVRALDQFSAETDVARSWR